MKGQAILGPSHPITGKFLPLPTLAISTGKECKKKERKSVRRLRWMKSEVLSPLGLADQSGVWLRWEKPHRTLNKTPHNNRHFFFYGIKNTKQKFTARSEKMKTFFYLKFSPPSSTVFGDCLSQWGWWQKGPGREDRRRAPTALSFREHSLPLVSALTCYSNAYTASLSPRPFPAQK